MKEGKTIHPGNPQVMAVPCILCGTFTDLTEREADMVVHGSRIVKVCRECKASVAWAKEQMKNSG